MRKTVIILVLIITAVAAVVLPGWLAERQRYVAGSDGQYNPGQGNGDGARAVTFALQIAVWLALPIIITIAIGSRLRRR